MSKLSSLPFHVPVLQGRTSSLFSFPPLSAPSPRFIPSRVQGSRESFSPVLDNIHFFAGLLPLVRAVYEMKSFKPEAASV